MSYRMGRYRFEFEYPGIGWVLFGKYNTDSLTDAKERANGIALSGMLNGQRFRGTGVRVVDGWIEDARNPHAAPRDRVRHVVSARLVLP